MTKPYELTAVEAADLIKSRQLSCEDLTRSCLERIQERDPLIRAWSYIDPERAIRMARELDKRPAMGVLHGVPVSFKDVIDTIDMPTSQNSPLYFGHMSGKDAACAAVVRHSGGLILGKMDTVEFAAGGRKALTRNPHNVRHTPGGSSSGPAAAVGDLHVPLSFGTQTGGSLIRPASFNGVYAIKPTYGIVSNEGVKQYAPALDTVGWYGRCVADLELVAQAFRLPDIHDSNNAAGPYRIGICRTPMWQRAEEAGRLALAVAAQRLAGAGHEVSDFDLPVPFEQLYDAVEAIRQWEAGFVYLPEYLQFGSRLHEELRGLVEQVSNTQSEMMISAYDLAAAARPAFDQLIRKLHLDAVLTPAAPGEAPEGLETTGHWVFNATWTLLHVPCVAIPAGLGPRALPIGVQLVGPRYSDAALLRVARAIAPAIDVHGPINSSRPQ